MLVFAIEQQCLQNHLLRLFNRLPEVTRSHSVRFCDGSVRNIEPEQKSLFFAKKLPVWWLASLFQGAVFIEKELVGFLAEGEVLHEGGFD